MPKAASLSSVATVPIRRDFFVWRHQPWLGLAAAIGLLSGAEMVGNTSSPEPSSLKVQNILFGVLYAVAAVATWLVLLR